MTSDLRHAIRGLLRTPSFSVIAIAALALGMGANTAVFSIVNAVLFRPLPFPRAGEIVVVSEKNAKTGAASPVSPGNFTDLATAVPSFTRVAAAEAWSGTFTDTDPAERVSGLRVSASLLDVLEAWPALGRRLRAEDEQIGRHRVLLISDGLWRRRFGGNPSIVGRTVRVDGEAYEIAGVMPEHFRFPPFWATRAEMWTPLAFTPERGASRSGSSLRVFARLAPGASTTRAQSELDALGSRLASAYPNTNTNRGFTVAKLHDVVTGDARPALLMLLGAAAFVLLIAAANVANLLLARCLARRKEFAVRAALGAGRGRIVRQMLAEGAVLSVAGGIAGLLVGAALLDAARGMLAGGRLPGLPRAHDISIDWQVMAFAVAASLLTTAIFGFIPALAVTAGNAADSLKEAGRNSGGGAATSRLRQTLVVAEVALTLMLLVGAALLARSLGAMMRVDPGFRPSNVLTAVVSTHGTVVAPPELQVAFYTELLERMAARPGILNVAAINHLPLAGDTWGTSFFVEGRETPAPGDTPSAVFRIISPDYFKTMGTDLLAGRDFKPSDDAAAVPVAIVNRTLAQRYWPAGDAVGKRLRASMAGGGWLLVAGVVEDVKQAQWTGSPSPELYVPFRQHSRHFSSRASSVMTFVLRTTGDPASVAGLFRDEVTAVAKNVPVYDVMTLEEVVSESLRSPRSYAASTGAFAVLALLLAGIGIYGVIAYLTTGRMQEFGVRAALGAGRRQLLALVFRDAVKLVAAGVVIGIAGAAVLVRLMDKLLYGVSAFDPAAFAAGVVVLALATAGASLAPALRAARTDPIIALRYE